MRKNLHATERGLYSRGIDLDVSTLAGWVNAAAATLMPLVVLIRKHVFTAERYHADDITIPVLARERPRTTMDLCARRPTLWRSRSASCRLYPLAFMSLPASLAHYRGRVLGPPRRNFFKLARLDKGPADLSAPRVRSRTPRLAGKGRKNGL